MKELTFEEFAEMCEEAGVAGSPEEMKTDYVVGSAVADVVDELHTAMENYPSFNSAHEGFGILKEEVDELWEHVKVKQGSRDLAAMRKEAIQVAAMAIRFAADVCNEDRGQA